VDDLAVWWGPADPYGGALAGCGVVGFGSVGADVAGEGYYAPEGERYPAPKLAFVVRRT